MATVNKVYNRDSLTLTWVCPGGVSKIRLRTQSLRRGLVFSASAAIEPFGNAYAWGANDSGQIGDGSTTYRSSPVAVAGGTQFRKLFMGSTISYGLNEWGALYGWGLNSNGGLGVGDQTSRSTPTTVLGGFRFHDMADNGSGGPGLRALAIAVGGQAYAMGLNQDGELGVGDVNPRSSPVAVLGGNLFRQLVCNNQFTHATSYGIDYNNKAWAWGYNIRGQLGVGDIVARSSPVAVLTSVGAACKLIVCGGDTSGNAHAYFLDTTGLAYGVGFNISGELGVGDVNPRSSPVAVLGGHVFSQLVCDNDSNAIGITAAGVAWAWGSNFIGGLGVGDTTPRSSPVAVLGGITFAKIKGIAGSWWGLSTSGVLYGWGINATYQLGTGDLVARSSPVAVLGGLTIQNFEPFLSDAGNVGVFMATPQGQIFAMGANTKGELGVGDALSRSSPVAVINGVLARTLDDWEDVTCNVTPGTTYTITLNRMNASFGNVGLGSDVEQVILQYEQ